MKTRKKDYGHKKNGVKVAEVATSLGLLLKQLYTKATSL